MREDKNENRWDKLLQIHTMGRDDSRSDLYRYPYEPTPYFHPFSTRSISCSMRFS